MSDPFVNAGLLRQRGDAWQVRAPAKLNFTLAVKGRRPDGFHEIESWVVTIDLCDALDVREADRFSLTVTGDANLAADETNLVARAVHALAKAAQRPARAAIHLQKSIPQGAGLGGGSSDAAATLMALNALWALHWPPQRLAGCAAEVGSDVSLFLFPPQSVVRGRGEQVAPLPSPWRGWVAVVLPPLVVATADVYRRWTATQTRTIEAARLARLAAADLAPQLFNDLEAAAFLAVPGLADLHKQLNALSDRPVRMTGSGCGLFTLFDRREDAENWADRVRVRLAQDAKCLVAAAL